MEQLGAYPIIIAGSIIVLLSFLFGLLAKRTNIPAVLMLIVLGIIIKYGLTVIGIVDLNFLPILEIIGIVGLIMIVLEAALELELTKKKIPIILKSSGVAALGLVASVFIAAFIIKFFIHDIDYMHALLYATPLSILSSAIVIPSVNNLDQHKKEFHIYESTISDILGIMLFYFLLGIMGTQGGHSGLMENPIGSFFLGLAITILVGVAAGYILILVFQHIQTGPKLFLLISMLILLYAVGKLMHLSPLIIILIFGLMVSNSRLFFRGPIKKYLHQDKFERIESGLHMLTLETAFVVRTFFFVIFGASIVLSSLMGINVLVISLVMLFVMYGIRWMLLKLFVGSDLLPELWVAPRGLITILLFYAIPPEHQVESFDSGILLFVIIATGVIMTLGMLYGKSEGHPLTDEPVLSYGERDTVDPDDVATDEDQD